MYTREWLVQSTRYYQQLHFFEEYSHLSDDQLADQLILLGQQETGERETSRLFYNGYDWLLIELDKKRVLSAETDILYAEEPPEYDFEGYIETLQELAAISRGIFLPQVITKASIGSIEFILNNKRYTLVPDGPPDEPLILAGQINLIILDTGYQFEQWNLYPTVFLVMLNLEEKRRLAEEKGWKFLSDRWMFEN